MTDHIESRFSTLKSIGLNSVDVEGDLLFRLQRSFDRLEEKEYQLPDVIKQNYEWPADWEGRTVLALTLLSQATHRQPKHLDAILDEIPRHLNEKGYMGKVHPQGITDEQQLSGHSWFLRGLCEHYAWTGDIRSHDMLVRMTEQLLLPTLDAYAVYPIKPEERAKSGEAVGSLTGKAVNGWLTSTDIGCAFIPLDGATHVYEITKDPRLKALIDAMIAKFLEADLIGTSFQTHSTLTACRSILRYHDSNPDAALLDAARRIYALYRTQAMTENFENYNWFGRPQWTEPCAVIDSFITTVQLWRKTGDASYLEDAHRIYFNGMGSEQRPNGGYGCNMCSGAQDEYAGLAGAEVYEAFWCCTMRGGEGLARAAEFSMFADDERITLPFYNSGEYQVRLRDGDVTLKVQTDYPEGGKVRIDVVQSFLKRPMKVMLFLPSWAPKESVKLNVDGSPILFSVQSGFAAASITLNQGTSLEFSFRQGLRVENTINENSIRNHYAFWHGPLILGIKNSDAPAKISRDAEFTHVNGASYRIKGTELLLSPINDVIYLSEEEARSYRRRILFSNTL